MKSRDSRPERPNILYFAERSRFARLAGSAYSEQSARKPVPPPGLTYVEVAAGFEHTVARLSDGSVVAWGANGSGQCNVPAPPPGLTYVEVAAGYDYTIARLSDGSAVRDQQDNRCRLAKQ